MRGARAIGLRRAFGRGVRNVHALDGVSFDVPSGAMTAIRGPSGAGKTTLLLTLAGLLRPTAGSVEIDGADLYAVSERVRARIRSRAIGMVFQQFHLVPYLTVEENVLAPAFALPDPLPVDRARTLVAELGLGERSGHRPSALSTGERQRTALARALLNDPGLILADEPTGNLDDASASVVVRRLHRAAAAGKAVLVVTHDPRVLSVVDRVWTMAAGRIVDAGKTDRSGGEER